MSTEQWYNGLKNQPAHYSFTTSHYPQYQLICIHEGLLYLTVREVVIPLKPGGMVVLPVGSVFRLHCEEVGYQGVCVVRTGEMDASYTGEATAHGSTPTIRMLSALVEEEALNPGERAASVQYHVSMLLLEYSQRVRKAQQPNRPEEMPATWVQMAQQSIEKSIYTGQSVQRCLAGIPLSYRQLSRHFMALTSLTPKQYQLHCRVEEAQRLLAATQFPITTIALELGFASSQHFSSQFVRHTGEPPSHYRARVRGNGG